MLNSSKKLTKIHPSIVLLILVSLAFFLSIVIKTENEVQPRTNIIYINIDDLGWTDLGCQGSTFYETPNIDRLASQGMTFTDAYAPAANCSPSRASCLTGQYSPRHGVYTVGSSERGNDEDRKLEPTKNREYIKDDQLTIAHALKREGYKTCTIGKWHISKNPLKNGFDINIAGKNIGGPERYHSPYKYPNLSQKRKGEYLTDRLTEEAIDFLQDNTETPFFLYLAHYAVHAPFQAKPSKKEKFAKKKGNNAHNSPTFAAMIEILDENIGRLMDALDALDLAQNTLVIFTSDNGGIWKKSKQWPLRAGKGSYYEGGIRVPLFVRWPEKIKPNTTCSVPVSGIDFFPTFLEALKIISPENKQLDGASLMPLLTQSGVFVDRPLFWHFPVYIESRISEQTGSKLSETRDPKFRTRPGSVIRCGDWKLHEYFEDVGIELYNLKENIGETNNLAEKLPIKTKELHDMLIEWRQKMAAPVPSELNPNYQSDT